MVLINPDNVLVIKGRLGVSAWRGLCNDFNELDHSASGGFT